MISNAKFAAVFPLIRKNILPALVLAAFGVAIIKLLTLYNSADTDDGRWQQFKVEHHCIQQHGQEGSQRLSWKCDDGKVYFGWRQQR